MFHHEDGAEADVLIGKVADLLPRFSYRISTEFAFQDGLEQVLRDSGVPYLREHVAGPADRFDFLVHGRIVIEAKVKGSMSPALLQAQRYASRDDVDGVIVVTNRYWGAGGGSHIIKGKPILVVQVRGILF